VSQEGRVPINGFKSFRKILLIEEWFQGSPDFIPTLQVLPIKLPAVMDDAYDNDRHDE